MGSVFGLGVQIYSNGVRKLPLFAQPQHHVIAVVTGAVAGLGVSSWTEQ